jgi:hypothetical protein
MDLDLFMVPNKDDDFAETKSELGKPWINISMGKTRNSGDLPTRHFFPASSKTNGNSVSHTLCCLIKI